MGYDPERPAEVLVVGEALVDVVSGAMGTFEHPGGSPANVALGLGRLEVNVALLTRIGRDERGKAIAEHLERSGVRVLPESWVDAPTSTAIATISLDGSAHYIFDIEWSLPGILTGVQPRVIHTGSIAAFLSPGADVVRALLWSASDMKATEVTFDPNIRPALLSDVENVRQAFEAIAGLATVVKMSEEDASWLYPNRSPFDVLTTVRALGPRLAVMTLGGEGSILSAGAFLIEVPASRVDVIDTIGAGDTYMAVLIDAVLEEGTQSLTPDVVRRIGRRASRAAALTVSRAGAELPTKSELDNS
ncbi:carbohydrate kinase family protein [Glaciibacter sp. 2TAF33]|uniref:carbohydrate kinase family protein n=1 Tax=Glaciibacter sp. 2TAF33 TaxID=3233015 RepID=UPI003F8E7232